MVYPNGAIISAGNRLQEHLENGGCISIAKLQKYFRITRGELRVLRDGEKTWSEAHWNLWDMAREFVCMACSAPGDGSDCEYTIPTEAADILYRAGYEISSKIDGRDIPYKDLKWRLTGNRFEPRFTKRGHGDENG